MTRRVWRSGLALVISSCLAITAMAGQRPRQAPSRDSLEAFLRTYFADRTDGDDETIRYDFAFVDIDADNSPEAVVYAQGRTLCGSGGCRTLILRFDGSSYRVVSRLSITRPPIRVLETTTNGWRDLSVRVAGGGSRAHEAILPFDGKTYPRNPSVAPSRQARRAVSGKVLIAPDREGTLLYK